MRVRKATIDDIPWLCHELKEFSHFFKSKKQLYSDRAPEIIRSMIENESFVFLLVEHNDGARMGFITGVLTPHMFNPFIKMLSELFWWVNPLYRKTGAGALLLTAFTEFGQKNADWITFVLEDNSPVPAEALTSRGFRLKETSYLMEID